MTLQEAFDKVWHWFVVDRRGPSMETDAFSLEAEVGTCRYRGYDGNRCAIGLLITDDEYTPAMEGRTVASVITNFDPQSLKDIPRRALAALQNIHDDAAEAGDSRFNEVIESRLRAFAKRRKLVIPAADFLLPICAPAIPTMDFRDHEAVAPAPEAITLQI